MKKISLISLTLFIICCNSDQNNMIVSGNVDGLRKGTIYLQKEIDSTIVSLDSLKIRGNRKRKEVGEGKSGGLGGRRNIEKKNR